LGNQAALIRQFAHGIDERPLIPAREPQKTFSHQETFGSDLTDEDYVEATLRRMADSLFAKVREEGHSVRTLSDGNRCSTHARAAASARLDPWIGTDAFDGWWINMDRRNSSAEMDELLHEGSLQIRGRAWFEAHVES
jgi:nucleotidyltransferase/DNA polymerase involved in DNA repair